MLVVAGGSRTRPMSSLGLFINLLGMPLGPLGVLLGQGAVLGRLTSMRISRATQLLSLRGVSVRLLTVPRCFGSKPLSPDPSLLGTAPEVRDDGHEREQRHNGNDDHENR
ncbi:MAG TPA: hypothetical protein VN458_00945 [Solirubrobacterales bacterium]|nr:hypothetical protein [Solirubrobacterales bacterium]